MKGEGIPIQFLVSGFLEDLFFGFGQFWRTKLGSSGFEVQPVKFKGV